MKYLFYFSFFLISFGVSAQNLLPDVALKTLDGTNTSLSEASATQSLTIISLWATWCVPCIKELDAISEVYQDWQDETNVSLIAVSIDDARTVKRVKPMINGKGWDYTILLDTNNDVKRALGAATVPLTILVKDGVIVYRHSGYAPGAEDELYEEILAQAD
ncbi:MAG: TlpA disulfide reductase family protein [Flavobacteriaceae bacterium]|nr:TlpA disulfide reductase family protein [Flavobacteriaceae bacterium]MDG1962226.1 TlpA disulfide reductase family protein [Flavobacteriaceae bacterium]